MSYYGVPPISADLRVWAEKFSNWIQSTRSFLTHRRDYDSAAEDGVLLWDRTYKYPIVSSTGSFKEIVVKQSVPASSVGASGDTAGLISWDTNYIYICTASHDGSSNIWKRVALTGGAF